MKRIKSVFCLACVLCACLLVFCGCSQAKVTSAETETTAAAEQETTAPKAEPEIEQIAEPVEQTEPELKTEVDLNSLLGGFKRGQAVQQLDGVEIVSGRVERVRGSMIYAPSSGGGFFTVNGAIAKDSEIVITFNPVGILRYKLAVQADTEKTVRAEIRVFKEDQLLVSCVQKEMELEKGVNDVDVCIDTGENAACKGKYTLQFYLDDVLVKENEFEA